MQKSFQHVGVLGMHWGHRKSPEEQAAKTLKKKQDAWDKKKSNVHVQLTAYNNAARYANSVLIPKINKKYGKYDWSSIDTTDPYNPKGDPKLVKSYKRYMNEYVTSFNKVFDQKLTDLIGERPK